MSGTPEPLDVFLRRTRAAALKHLQHTGAPSEQHLTLIMGNEAGDLDSLASAIAFAYLLTHLPHPALTPSLSSSLGVTRAELEERKRRTVFAPLIQTAHADLYLRPENEVICRFAGIESADHAALLTIDAVAAPDAGAQAGVAPDSLRMDIAADPRLGGAGGGSGTVSFGLVDHASLIPRWGPHEHREVRYLVDHHKDEGAHPYAWIRYLRGPGSVPAGETPIGSAASLITELFQEELIKAAAQPAGSVIPKAIADLLISAIVIDTDNLRPAPRGRATARDILSHAILLPLSSFAPGTSGPNESGGPGHSVPPSAVHAGSGTAGGDSPKSGQNQDAHGPSMTARGSNGSGDVSDAPLPSVPGAQLQAECDSADECSQCDCQEEAPPAAEAEEPAMFVMSEEVDLETDAAAARNASSQARDIPACAHAHQQEQRQRQRTDFKARCDSEASTAGTCHGARPKVSVERPCEEHGHAQGSQKGANGDKDDDEDDEDDVLEQMAGRDLYRILGLKRGVEASAIRTAYRREALKCHPDRARSLRDAERRTRRFKLLVNAYEILSDPVKRRQYDLFYDPLTTSVPGSTQGGAETPGAGTSYASSSTFSHSYSSSYTSSTFFDTYGSSSPFSSTSFFSTSPPHGQQWHGAGGFGANAGWKYETYEQLRAEELARTETRTIAESLFAKREYSPPDAASIKNTMFGKPPARVGMAATPAARESDMAMSQTIVLEPKEVSIDVGASKGDAACGAKASLSTPTATATAPAPVPSAAVAVAPVPALTTTAPPKKQFSFVWESPAESLRRARARPGGPVGFSPAARPAAIASGGSGGGGGVGMLVRPAPPRDGFARG